MEFKLSNLNEDTKFLKVLSIDTNICSSAQNKSLEEFFNYLKFNNAVHKEDFMLYEVDEGENCIATVVLNKYGLIFALCVKTLDVVNEGFVKFLIKNLKEVFKDTDVKKLSIYLKQKGLVAFNAAGFRNIKCICDMEQRTSLNGYSYLLEYDIS